MEIFGLKISQPYKFAVEAAKPDFESDSRI